MLYDYGGRMEDLMKEKGITERQMAEGTKLSLGVIRGFLQYGLPINFTQFEKMLKVIDVSVVDFFSVDKPVKKILI